MVPLWGYSLRHEGVLLPNLCALCAMEKPSCSFKAIGRHCEPEHSLFLRFTVVKNSIKVPLCDLCKHRTLRFRRPILLIALAVGIVIFIVTYNYLEQDMQPDPDHVLRHLAVGLLSATLAFLIVYFAGNMIKSYVDPASDIVRYDVECQRFFFLNEEYQATVMELNREGYYQVDYPLQK